MNHDMSIIIKCEVISVSVPDTLQSVLAQTGGTVTTAQANEAGFSNCR